MSFSNGNYTLQSEWIFNCPSDQIWPFIRSVPEWPLWWKGLEYSQPVAGSGSGQIETFDQIWRSPSGYKIRLRASLAEESWNECILCRVQGDLEGEGVLKVVVSDAPCRFIFTWRVRSTLRWMKYCEFFAHPVFEYYHHRLMANGEKGLNRILQEEMARNLKSRSA